MKVQDITCPSCGANLGVSDDGKSQKVSCAFCGKDFWLSDEVERSESKVNLSVENAEQAGYLFERGRMMAHQELNQPPNVQSETNVSRKKHSLWWLKLLGWVLFFPLMLIYKVLRSKRMTWGEKLLLCGLIIFVTIILSSNGGI